MPMPTSISIAINEPANDLYLSHLGRLRLGLRGSGVPLGPRLGISLLLPLGLGVLLGPRLTCSNAR